MPLKVRIELDRAVVLSQGVALAAPKVARVTRRALVRAMVRSPTDTGQMRAAHSMSMRVTRTKVVGRVEVAKKYAEMVHRGTKAHIIRPKGGALVFNWAKLGGVRTVVPRKGRGPTGLRKTKKGKVFFISKGFVRHPGTRARPWLVLALREIAELEGFEVSSL